VIFVLRAENELILITISGEPFALAAINAHPVRPPIVSIIADASAA